MGTSSCPSNGGRVERGRAGVEGVGTEEDGKRLLRGYEGSFMRTTRIKEQTTCKMNWGNSCTTTSRHCSACGKGGIGTTPKVDVLSFGAEDRREEVEYILGHKMCTTVSRERRACVKRGKQPLRQDGWRLTRNNRAAQRARARWVAKE